MDNFNQKDKAQNEQKKDSDISSQESNQSTPQHACTSSHDYSFTELEKSRKAQEELAEKYSAESARIMAELRQNHSRTKRTKNPSCVSGTAAETPASTHDRRNTQKETPSYNSSVLEFMYEVSRNEAHQTNVSNRPLTEEQLEELNRNVVFDTSNSNANPALTDMTCTPAGSQNDSIASLENSDNEQNGNTATTKETVNEKPPLYPKASLHL